MFKSRAKAINEAAVWVAEARACWRHGNRTDKEVLKNTVGIWVRQQVEWLKVVWGKEVEEEPIENILVRWNSALSATERANHILEVTRIARRSDRDTGTVRGCHLVAAFVRAAGIVVNNKLVSDPSYLRAVEIETEARTLVAEIVRAF